MLTQQDNVEWERFSEREQGRKDKAAGETVRHHETRQFQSLRQWEPFLTEIC